MSLGLFAFAVKYLKKKKKLCAFKSVLNSTVIYKIDDYLRFRYRVLVRSREGVRT